MNFIEIAQQYKKMFNEMSFERKDAINKLESLTYSFSQHVCKLFLWDNSQWRKDWKDEIYNYISQIKDITLKGGKSLKDSDYLKHFFNPYLETEEEMSKMLNSVSNTFMKKDNYPKPNNVDSSVAFTNYRFFVNSVLKVNALDYDEFIKLCNELIGE